VLDEMKRPAHIHEPLERVFTLLSRERKATMPFHPISRPAAYCRTTSPASGGNNMLGSLSHGLTAS
jgi:hypothetical protein